MYILGIDRCDLSRKEFIYKVCIANTQGFIIKAYPNVSRDFLASIINLPTLTEPAIWSDKEQQIIDNLTDREVIILKDYYIKKNNISRDPNEITPFYIFNKTARRYSAKQSITKSEKECFELPEVITYYNGEGKEDFYLTRLCYETLLLSRIQKFDESFKD